MPRFPLKLFKHKVTEDIALLEIDPVDFSQPGLLYSARQSGGLDGLKSRLKSFFKAPPKEPESFELQVLPTLSFFTPASRTSSLEIGAEAASVTESVELQDLPSLSLFAPASYPSSLEIEAISDNVPCAVAVEAGGRFLCGPQPVDIFEPSPLQPLRPILGCMPTPSPLNSVASGTSETRSMVPATPQDEPSTPPSSDTSVDNSPHVDLPAPSIAAASNPWAPGVNTIPFPSIQSKDVHDEDDTSSILSAHSKDVPTAMMTSDRSDANLTDAATSQIQVSSVEPTRCVSPALDEPAADISKSLECAGAVERIPCATDMKVLRFIGEGTTGTVYYVKDTVTRAKVALKVISKADKDDFTLSVLLEERNISEKLADSPWCIELYASWHDHDNLYFAMTAYPTDLDSELIKYEKLPPARARFYMAEIIIALTDIHSRGIIHRDVKAPNILIDREGHIVLADFGLSKDFHDEPTILERVSQPYWAYLRDERPGPGTEPRDPSELHFVTSEYRGSELEMAPEIHLRQPYAFGVDFWSAAVVLYWMLTGRPPWYACEASESDASDTTSSSIPEKPLALKVIEDDLYWDESDEVDEVTQDFLHQMLKKSPASRLVISYQMPRHPYFNGINWPAMRARTVPTPWIPEEEICHTYEPTTPTFVAGAPYAEGEEDPYPDIIYVSDDAKHHAPSIVPTPSSHDILPPSTHSDSSSQPAQATDPDPNEADEDVCSNVTRSASRTTPSSSQVILCEEIDGTSSPNTPREPDSGDEQDFTLVHHAAASSLGLDAKQCSSQRAEELDISTESESDDTNSYSRELVLVGRPSFSDSCSLSSQLSFSLPSSRLTSTRDSVEVMHLNLSSRSSAASDHPIHSSGKETLSLHSCSSGPSGTLQYAPKSPPKAHKAMKKLKKLISRLKFSRKQPSPTS